MVSFCCPPSSLSLGPTSGCLVRGAEAGRRWGIGWRNATQPFLSARYFLLPRRPVGGRAACSKLCWLDAHSTVSSVGCRDVTFLCTLCLTFCPIVVVHTRGADESRLERSFGEGGGWSGTGGALVICVCRCIAVQSAPLRPHARSHEVGLLTVAARSASTYRPIAPGFCQSCSQCDPAAVNRFFFLRMYVRTSTRRFQIYLGERVRACLVFAQKMNNSIKIESDAENISYYS